MKTSNKKSVSRDKRILRVSVAGIIANIILAAVKVALGMFSGSVAIMSDAVNNITDSSSSIITIIGTRLALKKPDRKHPFGHGRAEYLTSMAIAAIILVTGGEMLVTSIKSIIHPEEMNFSVISLVIIGITIVTKIVLGVFTQNEGKAVKSDALIASGADAKNDALISLITLLSAGVYMIWNISLDGWAGVILSGFIIKTGVEVLVGTIGKILGERGDSELADSIRAEVAKMPEVLSVNDLILNNYGPEIHNGSVNIEVDSNLTVGDLYPKIHSMQMKLLSEYNTYLVFGLYAIDTSSPVTERVSEILKSYCENNEHLLGFHGVCVDNDANAIYADILIDYDADRDKEKQTVCEMINAEYPDKTVIITIDTEFA